VHISNGYDNGLFRWMFDSLSAQNARFDIIGMSLYPTAGNWNTLTSECLSNLNDMAARYGKEVMITEVGMASSAAQESKNMLIDLIAKVKSVPNGKGIGVFYWEPESYSWCSYSIALDAFLSNVNNHLKNSSVAPAAKSEQLTVSTTGNSIILGKNFAGKSKSVALYDLGGKLIALKTLGTNTIDLHNDLRVTDGAYIVKIKTLP
jgi:arabinogalactan endo-1,4-beta-galactosidase